VIVKVQVSLSTTQDKQHMLLVYNIDKSIYYDGEADPEVLALMEDRAKVYFESNISGTNIALDHEVPDPGW